MWRGGGYQRYREIMIWMDVGRGIEMTRRTRDNHTEIRGIRYNVAHDPIGTVHNAALASALGN